MFESVLMGILGVIFIVMGYMIWKKERISLLHEYHYDKVSEEEKRSFCKISGWGILIMGIGLVITAVVIRITSSPWSFLVFAASFVMGLGFLIYAGKKYNT